ncbi:serine/threonine protein kinase [Komarekiella sp. 'clone 1']|uniref:Serine/threonine protein kinase n=1 Tax=Komarekiella delphini-convector SJRDD-AB1 TaxID=2593771 RepID=A0AA40SVB6_9NOST|nr:AAA-like domain-containing protein [Komarekiella delphini-convector]MBD6615595.1 serine/threonine protein kinase [Komarekiella delphini-convector SJRDD-AB1]
MNLESVLNIVNRKLVEIQHRPLNATEVLILRGTWQYHTYSQIAQEQGYSPGYFTNVVAPELCRRLTEIIGERVTKKNCRALLESYAAAQTSSVGNILDIKQDISSPRFPSGSVPIDSPFYIENSPVERQAYTEISKPGALVRIKAPKEMGKTSLLLRILEHANRLGHRTVSLNLEQIDQDILSDLNRFLRWLCANIALQLQIEPKLDDYWDEDIGSKVSCSLYLRSYVLEQIDTPVVLALDEVNQMFEHPQVAKEVLPLLRSWYEEAKRLPIWQKLRLIVVHSTDIYVPLQLHQSPFNVGLPVQLTCFSLDQVQQLAQRYGLNWTDGQEAKQLIDMVGGHPALVNIALYHLNQGELTLPQLLETAPTSTGIYHHHLQRHCATLQEQPELAIALNAVVNATEPVRLEPILAYKLSSMGLIKLDNNKAMLSCHLYRQYFHPKFLPEDRQILTNLT